MSDSMKEFGALLRKMRDDAFAADPLLAPALAQAQERDSDIGWLDVAAALEKAREAGGS